jgi:phytoene dehydrogenase-like protein
MKKAPVVIVVGAGLAGLTCAVKLHEAGVPILVLEASHNVGGRAASDRFEAYILDRGFQTLLSAYPAAQQVLNYPSLNLHPFYPGVQIWWKGKFHKFVPTLAHPLEALQSMQSTLGSLTDRMRVFNYARKLTDERLDDLLKKAPQPLPELLSKEGFSQEFIDRFWRPLCGLFLLDRKLETSSRSFEFVMRAYFQGNASLPVSGMSAIANQLAERLPKGAIRTKSPVTAIQDGIVSLPQGETLATQAIVVATDPQESARLLSDSSPPAAFRKVTCLYYETKTPPFEKPFFMLNGEDTGLVHHLCVPSQASRSYASEGHQLLAATILDDIEEDEHDLDLQVREHMEHWFQETVHAWRFLKVYRIKQALAVEDSLDRSAERFPLKVRPGVYRCGDYTGVGLINSAIESGNNAASLVLEELKARVS